MSDNRFNVKFAVYGALNGGNENNSQAVSVVDALQNLLQRPGGESSIIKINDQNLSQVGFSSGNKKSFAACLSIGGRDVYFACKEGETVNFNNWLSTTENNKTIVESAI